MAAGAEANTGPSAGDSFIGALARLTGFITLAGMAVAILAGVVLLPAYARVENAKYERDCVLAYNQDARTLIRINDRLIQHLPDDDILTLRLLNSQQALLSGGEVRIPAADGPARPPDMVEPPRSAPPVPTDNAFTRAAARIVNPRTRRGLLLMAAGAIATAMLLFGPRRKSQAVRS